MARARGANGNGVAQVSNWLDGGDVLDRLRSTFASPSYVPPRLPQVNWTTILLGLWAFGATVLLARLGRGLWRVDRVVRAAQPVTDRGWLAMLDAATAATGCRRRVRLLTSSEVEVPATDGLLRPTFVVPPTA